MTAIRRVRTRLNFRIVSGGVLGLFPAVCGISSGVVFLWRLFSSMGIVPGASWFSIGMAIPTVLGLCLAGSIVAVAFALPKMLGLERAAQWLDDRLGARGAISAALSCMGKEQTDAIADRVKNDASQALSRMDSMEGRLFPRAVLVRRGSLAAAVLLACIILVAVWNPRADALALRAAEGKIALLPGKGQGFPEKEPFPSSGGKGLAPRLFPEDKRLEALAEQAIRENDKEALAFLMEEYGLDPSMLEDLSGEDDSRDGSSAVPEELEGSNAIARGKDGGSEKQGSARKEDGTSGQGGSGKKGESQDGKPKQLPGSPERTESGAGADSGQGQSSGQNDDESSSGMEGTGGGGGNQAGTGGSPGVTGLKGKSADIGQDAVIKYREKGSPLGFIMPAKDMKQTFDRVIPDAMRGSEAAMSRNGTPLEYEAYVQFYFETLSKETR